MIVLASQEVNGLSSLVGDMRSEGKNSLTWTNYIREGSTGKRASVCMGLFVIRRERLGKQIDGRVVQQWPHGNLGRNFNQNTSQHCF